MFSDRLKNQQGCDYSLFILSTGCLRWIPQCHFLSNQTSCFFMIFLFCPFFPLTSTTGLLISTETTDLVLVKATRCLSADSHTAILHLRCRVKHLCFKPLVIFQKPKGSVNLLPPRVHHVGRSQTAGTMKSYMKYEH